MRYQNNLHSDYFITLQSRNECHQVYQVCVVLTGPAPSGERTVIDKAEVPATTEEKDEKVTQDPGQGVYINDYKANSRIFKMY